MEVSPTTLDPYLQRQVDHGISGIDVMHGHLKVLMLEAEQQLTEAQRVEEDNDYSDAMESMERKYWEGQVDALGHLYSLTYDLSFAIAAKEAADENL
jgi:hypothetical protein